MCETIYNWSLPELILFSSNVTLALFVMFRTWFKNFVKIKVLHSKKHIRLNDNYFDSLLTQL